MDHSTTLARRERTDERRTAIATAARALLVEKGFEGLRTRDIADRVGINIATLHYHVPSKEALVELVAHSLTEDFHAQHLRRPRAEATSLEKLRHEFADFREIMLDDPGLGIVLTELVDRGRRDPRLKAIVTPLVEGWRNSIAGFLAEGRDDGTFRPDMDPEAAAAMIQGALAELSRFQGSNTAALERLAAEIERAVVNPAFSQG